MPGAPPARSRASFRRLIRTDDRRRGQSVVEFALVLPVLLFLMAATLDLGRLAFARVTLENAAREGAFQASRTPASYTANQPCPSNGLTNLVVCRTQLETRGSPITIAPSDIQLECSPADCSPGLGNTVTITASGTFTLLTPVLAVFFGGTSMAISSSATTQIETLPSPTFVAPWATPTPTPTASASPSPSSTMGPCELPSAGFTFSTSPGNGKAPVTLTVLDASTFVSCPIQTWEWSWGDGSTFFGQAPGSHTYGSAGSYPVALTVANGAGSNTTGAAIIVVKK